MVNRAWVMNVGRLRATTATKREERPNERPDIPYSELRDAGKQLKGQDNASERVNKCLEQVGTKVSPKSTPDDPNKLGGKMTAPRCG